MIATLCWACRSSRKLSLLQVVYIEKMKEKGERVAQRGRLTLSKANRSKSSTEKAQIILSAVQQLIIDDYCFHRQELACVFLKRFLYLLFPFTLLNIFFSVESWICIFMATLTVRFHGSWYEPWLLQLCPPCFSGQSQGLRKWISRKIFHCQSLELLSPLTLTL